MIETVIRIWQQHAPSCARPDEKAEPETLDRPDDPTRDARETPGPFLGVDVGNYA